MPRPILFSILLPLNARIAGRQKCNQKTKFVKIRSACQRRCAGDAGSEIEYLYKLLIDCDMQWYKFLSEMRKDEMQFYEQRSCTSVGT